jgi:hypothetical protein
VEGFLQEGKQSSDEGWITKDFEQDGYQDCNRHFSPLTRSWVSAND